MAAAFGFLGGDLGASIELVTTVINALGQNSDSVKEYRELAHQLYSLETALLRVKRLHVGDSQHGELVGLRQAATGCHQTIDDFWQKIQKYQPHLQANGSSSRLKDSWMKIKWGFCAKEDVLKFKSDLTGHTESIQMLLAIVQVESATIFKESQEQHNKTLATKLQAGYAECLERLSSSIGPGKQLLHIAAEVLRTNFQIFQVVVAIQTMMADVPGQIDRQQPVYLIDALGKYSPFHLEFVRSAEALTAVIKINFRETGELAVRKIERGRFVIQDSATKQDIDLAANWDTCFHPGQRVEMSIIFTDCGRHSHTNCPKCGSEGICSMNNDVECTACGTTFCRIEDAELNVDDLKAEAGLLLTGATEPKGRSGRLLGLIQRVRINILPLKSLPVEPTSSFISALGSQFIVGNPPASLSNSQEDAALPHPGSFSNPRFSQKLWTCCDCGEANIMTSHISCNRCGCPRCENCEVYLMKR